MTKNDQRPGKHGRPYRSSNRAAAAGETRARIVAAARTLLGGADDLPAFSLDAVAREAGVTRLTVYNQFASKQGLLEAVFDEVAEQGGLFAELPPVLAATDMDDALRRFVGVFCRFWSAHGHMMPKFHAVISADDDMALSLRQRAERRRQALTALVKRLRPLMAKPNDFVDVVFALTSFETFQALSVRDRSAKSIEALIQALVSEVLRAAPDRGG